MERGGSTSNLAKYGNDNAVILNRAVLGKVITLNPLKQEDPAMDKILSEVRRIHFDVAYIEIPNLTADLESSEGQTKHVETVSLGPGLVRKKVTVV
jgi:hypothetical protein